MTHELKTWPEYFEAVSKGIKTFELRKHDRNFQVGDFLLLKEWQPTGFSDVSPNEKTDYYTGADISVQVTYILTGELVPAGYCVMSIKLIP